MKKRLFLGGDYNICPTKKDVANEDMILNDAVYQENQKIFIEKFVMMDILMLLEN